MWRGYFSTQRGYHLSRLGGLVEHCELTQRVPCQSLGLICVFAIFQSQKPRQALVERKMCIL